VTVECVASRPFRPGQVPTASSVTLRMTGSLVVVSIERDEPWLNKWVTRSKIRRGRPSARAGPGTIEEVLRGDPFPRYWIRWDDGHESVYSPAAGSRPKPAVQTKAV